MRALCAGTLLVLVSSWTAVIAQSPPQLDIIDTFVNQGSVLSVGTHSQPTNDPRRPFPVKFGVLVLRSGAQSPPQHFVVSRVEIYDLFGLWSKARDTAAAEWKPVGILKGASGRGEMLVISAGPTVRLTLAVPWQREWSFEVSSDMRSRFDLAMQNLKDSVTGTPFEAMKRQAAQKAEMDRIIKEMDETRKRALQPIKPFESIVKTPSHPPFKAKEKQ